MLQKLPYPDHSTDDEQGQLLSLSYVYDILRRRFLLFIIPFVLVLAVGAGVTWLLPAVYFSEGKILVESQQIPTELVRPTVTALANERIQVIEQRIMTRDKLLAIANKFQLYTGGQQRLSATDMLDFIRSRTRIKPLELKLPSRLPNQQAIAFTIGFEHEQPGIAMRVANEFVTMILEEDVRTRTSFATETTKFLDREVRRLEGELNSIEVQIANLKSKKDRPIGGDINERQLLALRSELLQKSAVYSDTHPDLKVLKQRIAALESLISPTNDNGIGIDALERTQASMKLNLASASQKLSAARLGESLERGQQSERLEVIEQPTLPQKPISPNRIKIFALVVGLAVMTGAGLVIALEMMDGTLHRTADIHRLIDSNLVVSIPYIATNAELVRQRTRKIVVSSLLAGIIAAVLVVAFFLWPDLLPRALRWVDGVLAAVRL